MPAPEGEGALQAMLAELAGLDGAERAAVLALLDSTLRSRAMEMLEDMRWEGRPQSGAGLPEVAAQGLSPWLSQRIATGTGMTATAQRALRQCALEAASEGAATVWGDAPRPGSMALLRGLLGGRRER